MDKALQRSQVEISLSSVSWDLRDAIYNLDTALETVDVLKDVALQRMQGLRARLLEVSREIDEVRVVVEAEVPQ